MRECLFEVSFQRKAKMKPPTSYDAGDVEEVQQQVSQEQGERNVAMAVCVQLAGRAIIRVVSRCEEAQDNRKLGQSALNIPAARSLIKQPPRLFSPPVPADDHLLAVDRPTDRS